METKINKKTIKALTAKKLRKIVLQQSKIIDESKTKHIRTQLPPEEHNRFLELVFQMIEQKKGTTEFIKILTERENNMQNFLNGFVNRYPAAKEYAEKYSA